MLSRPVGWEIRFLKLERLPAEGDCTFLQHYCLHTVHSLAWDQPSSATATNHNCTLARVVRCCICSLHPCTPLPAPLHFPPPLYKSSSPAPLGAPAPSNRKPATVRTRQHRRPPASVLCFNELLPRARRRVFSLPWAHNHHNLLRRVSSCTGGSAPTISCCNNKLRCWMLVTQTKLSLHRPPFCLFCAI